MITLFIISLIVYLGYNAAVICLYGLPVSISESCYLWPQKYGKHLFFAFCLLVSVPLMIFWLNCSEGTFQAPIFFACAALAFVGAAAEFKPKGLTKKVHFISAAICGSGSQLWIALYTWWWLGTIVLIIIAVILSVKMKGVDADYRITKEKKNASLYYFENAAFISAFIASLSFYLNGI